VRDVDDPTASLDGRGVCTPPTIDERAANANQAFLAVARGIPPRAVADRVQSRSIGVVVSHDTGRSNATALLRAIGARVQPATAHGRAGLLFARLGDTERAQVETDLAGAELTSLSDVSARHTAWLHRARGQTGRGVARDDQPARGS
jgi:hypothetical protein